MKIGAETAAKERLARQPGRTNFKAQVRGKGKAFLRALYLRDPSDSLNLSVAHLRKASGESHVEADLILLREKSRRDTNENQLIESGEGSADSEVDELPST